MPSTKLNISIITPSGTLFKSDHVDMVIACGTEGSLGILPHHSPIFTKLDPGEIQVEIEGKQRFFTIFQGFLHLNPSNQLTILAENAQRSEELDVQAIKKAKESAEKALQDKEKLSVTEILRAESSMRRAIMELKVAERNRLS